MSEENKKETEKYYEYFSGEKINNQYWVHKAMGKGSFGLVLRTYDYKNGKDIALKIIKKGKNYKNQGYNEVKLLRLINSYNKSKQYPIIMYSSYFEWKGYLCIAYPVYGQNIVEIMHKHDFMGFSLSIIKSIVKQLLECLHFLRNENLAIIHCDLKPENILIYKTDNPQIMLIDFGNSTVVEGHMYRYIQSRYYRAPEVLLELEYLFPIDMWSLGCIMCELKTSNPLFASLDEYMQFKLIVEICGMPTKKMIERALRKDDFFKKADKDSDYVLRWNYNTNHHYYKAGTKSIVDIITAVNSKLFKSEVPGDPNFDNFVDLIKKMLCVDPLLRIDPIHALRHPFVASSDSYSVSPSKEVEDIGADEFRKRIICSSYNSEGSRKSLDSSKKSSSNCSYIETSKYKRRIASLYGGYDYDLTYKYPNAIICEESIIEEGKDDIFLEKPELSGEKVDMKVGISTLTNKNGEELTEQEKVIENRLCKQLDDSYNL